MIVDNMSTDRSTKSKKGMTTVMGMAASQARFLGLTARKNNVEFEGQQINQQRTVLSNQSANYYNDLLGMSVPTPPSVDNYTKTVYSFEDGALANTLTSLIAEPGGLYTISYLSKWQDDYSAVSASTSIVTRTGTAPDYTYSIGATDLRELGSLDPSITDPKQQADRQREEEAWATLLEQKYGKKDWVVRYVTNTTTGAETPYFYAKDDLDKATYDDKTNTSLSNINCYTIGSEQKIEEHIAIEHCKVEKDSSGRFISISIPEVGEDGETTYTTYALTTQTTTDQDAYQDAMNEYEYQKQLYDQSIEDINSKIEIIQAEDKNLELRLKQLDTEQDAISNEVDAVSKVIEKNTESSFKTFG